MIRKSILYKLIFVCAFLSFTMFKTNGNDNFTTINKLQQEKLVNIANSMLDINADSSYLIYKTLLAQKSLKDINKIQSHIGIADVYKNKGNYSEAYDHLWDALLIAETTHDTSFLMEIQEDLGGLYSIYEKYDKAISHFRTALNLAKLYNKPNTAAYASINKIYYALAVTTRRAGDYPGALAYLDSSAAIVSANNLPTNSKAYQDAERGYILLQQNNMQKAKNHLTKANSYFEKNNLSYRVISNLYLGDYYAKTSEWQLAITQYNKSLTSLEESNTHGDMKVEILKKLSSTHEKLGNIDLAYGFLRQADIITDSLFNAKSALNRQLFQIRNKHKEIIREKDEHIKSQNLTIEKNRLVQSRLKIIIASLFSAVLFFAVLATMRSRMRKIKQEKAFIERQAQHDREKSETIMEIKNRELTASTLQMIEKDRNIEELLLELKNTSPTNFTKLNARISRGNKDMWEQFNKRFTEVNTSFYDRLRKKHPNLTPTELKHCALIKLNFDSKEMATLLNISLNSVHISRHRIRKKIGLERDENLSNYIADISTPQP